MPSREMTQDVTQFLIESMKIESTTGNEGNFATFVSSKLRDAGWFVEEQEIPGGGNRKNVFAKRSPDSYVRLLLNTHLDTVPPYLPPREDETKIYGRGSNDAKGQLSAMIYAANRIVQERPEIADQVGLLFVVGEELDHIGMIEANKLNLQPDFLVVGEPTENCFASIQKGALKIFVKTTGKAGHSGYPHTGVSAIHKLLEVLNDIMNHSWPKSDLHGDTTLNIGKISGGHALNAWAEKAEAAIFIRVTTSVDDVKRRLEQIVANRAELDYSLGSNDPVALSEPPFEAPRIAACFNTDLPYFDKRHFLKGVYLFGAGSITNAHSEDEFIMKADLGSAVNTYFQLISKLLEKK